MQNFSSVYVVGKCDPKMLARVGTIEVLDERYIPRKDPAIDAVNFNQLSPYWWKS